MPINPSLLASASGVKPGLLRTIGHVANELLSISAFKLQRTAPYFKVSPLVVTYALPEAYGGAAPNAAFGLPEYQSLFAMPWVLLTPEGMAAEKRGIALERRGVQAEYDRNLGADVARLSDADVTANLRIATLNAGRSTAAQLSRQNLRAEAIRRGLVAPGIGIFGGIDPSATLADVLRAHQGADGGPLEAPAPHGEADVLQALQATNPADP